jgi:hypothetical protein
MPGSKEDGGSRNPFSNLVDDLKDKFSDTKLHDAKISLHHKRSVEALSATPVLPSS